MLRSCRRFSHFKLNLSKSILQSNMSINSTSQDNLGHWSETSAENEKIAIDSSVKSLENLPLEVCDDPLQTTEELARKIFANSIVSDLLIRTSRLDVFSKELAKSFSDDLESLLMVRKLKYFYNQPTGAVLQQLASLVQRSSSNTVAISKWTEMVKILTAHKTLRTKPLCRFLQETDCPECYLENADHLEKFDPHGIYPTSIYGRCEGEVLAKSDASLVACTSKYTLTTTAKIVYGVLSPSNPELRNVYQPIGRCVAVVDKNVEKIYGAALQAYFDEFSIELKKLVLSAEEVDKDIATVQSTLVLLKKLGVRRNEPILVVGNGVLHDVIACAASLYHRNTPYIMVSTSVVAAIDAGLSPRTGCDGFGFKNLFGSFHPPVLALTDRSFFRTLHRGCLRHGIAEIVKMAIVKDEELFCLLEQEASALLWTKFGTEIEDFQGDRKSFEDICDLIIGKALEDYMRSEYSNMFETHQCRPHAYGHTWSPGYELPGGMLHGHAVSTGMGFGAYLSFCKGWITQHELDRILKLLSDLELALWHPIMENTQLVYKGQETMIEKRAGNLAAPVPKGIGKCGYLNYMPYDLLHKRLREYQQITQHCPRQGKGIEVHCEDIGIKCQTPIVNDKNKDVPKSAGVNGFHCNGDAKKYERNFSLPLEWQEKSANSRPIKSLRA